MVSAGPAATPTIMPLLETAVPSPMRCGTHSRTRVGSAGCMMAMPQPISMVAEIEQPRRLAPRRGRRPRAPVSASPAASVKVAPSRAISSEPGMAASAQVNTGKPDQQPDLGLGHPQVVADQRKDRRNRQNGDARRHPDEPEQARARLRKRARPVSWDVRFDEGAVCAWAPRQHAGGGGQDERAADDVVDASAVRRAPPRRRRCRPPGRSARRATRSSPAAAARSRTRENRRTRSRSRRRRAAPDGARLHRPKCSDLRTSAGTATVTTRATTSCHAAIAIGSASIRAHFR